MTEPRNKEEEHRIAFLKYLDSIISADTNVICIWGADDGLGLSIVETDVDNTKVDTTITATLSVKFYINNEDKLILTTVK